MTSQHPTQPPEPPGPEAPIQPDAEVVSSFDVDDASCTRRVEGVAPSAEVFYFHPTEESWALDDREVLCVALFARPRRGEL